MVNVSYDREISDFRCRLVELGRRLLGRKHMPRTRKFPGYMQLKSYSTSIAGNGGLE